MTNEQAKAFFNHSSLVTKWAAFEISSKKSRKQRIDALRKMIEVGKELVELQNYSSAASIVTALRTTPIAGLTQEWTVRIS